MHVHVQVVSVKHLSSAGLLQEELNMLMLVIPFSFDDISWLKTELRCEANSVMLPVLSAI